jgi:hypothetical protein
MKAKQFAMTALSLVCGITFFQTGCNSPQQDEIPSKTMSSV